jgi:hypothetical protein
MCARFECELSAYTVTGDTVEFTLKARSRQDMYNVLDELIDTGLMKDFYYDSKDWKYERAHEPGGFFHYSTFKMRAWK